MIYILTVRNKRFDDISLVNTTEVGSKIELDGTEYLIDEIIIVNPEEGIIEMKSHAIQKKRRLIKAKEGNKI